MVFPSFFSGVDAGETARQSIGTKQEKTIHRAIKYYLCPDEQCHEFKIGRFIADIYQDGRITEIQTGSFRTMKPKLNALLPGYPITIVYPIIRRKTLYTIDEMGILSSGKRSPRIGNPLSIGAELVQIKEFLRHPHLNIQIFLVDCDEYRTKAIQQTGRKKYERIDQYPKGEPTVIPLRSLTDYRALLPQTLTCPFTSKDFQKATKLGKTAATGALNVMRTLPLIRQVGKEGRSFLYEITEASE
jgi:uncharacterized protein YbgA (DUF1722 family)